MLVLTRRPGETIRIGPDIRVTVVSISSTQARIAIEAPDCVSIHREEVYERIAQANREAAQVSTGEAADRGSEAPAGERGS